ncbi:hypothetical protein [Brevundimonas aurantiaca]|uniref:hypothetical protein n=1 Tax=Brevundimonas aurantiaca TaxID=74316 RepID=UPI002FDD5035
MTDRAILWTFIRGIALIVTGFLAGAGASTFCAIRNLARFGYLDPTGASPGLGFYLVLTALTFAWLIAAGVFFWRNKNPAGYLLSAAAFVVFVISVVNVLTTAYPVCNAF